MKTTILVIISIIILTTIIMGLFYQYQIRPLKIRIECSNEARYLDGEEFDINYPACYYEHFYSECLKERGLKNN